MNDIALGLRSNPILNEAERSALRAALQVLRAASKRLADIVVASLSLLILAPVILVAAVAIKMTMGGPVVYKHRRVGRGGLPFACYKLRSMVPNSDAVLEAYLASNPEAAAEWDATRKLRHDPRITWLGRFLRRSSIDELPQLFNVLAGDMSCVGPRPIVFGELVRYGAGAGHYLKVRPGLTGLWQVSGRSRMSYAERVALDVHYVSNRSFLLDAVILLKTVPALARTAQAH